MVVRTPLVERAEVLADERTRHEAVGSVRQVALDGRAVNDAFRHPLKAMKAAFKGPKLTGPMAPELPFQYVEGTGLVASVPLSEVKHRTRESSESPGVAATR